MDSLFNAQYLRDRDVLQQKIDARGGTMLLSDTGLAIGTDANDINLATPFSYMIDGEVFTKNKVVDAVTGAGSAFGNPAAHALILVMIDKAGVITFTLGTSAVVANKISLPPLTGGLCPIGLIYVFTASTAAFTMGTTDFDASNVVSTYESLVGFNGFTSLALIGAMPPIKV